MNGPYWIDNDKISSLQDDPVVNKGRSPVLSLPSCCSIQEWMPLEHPEKWIVLNSICLLATLFYTLAALVGLIWTCDHILMVEWALQTYSFYDLIICLVWALEAYVWTLVPVVPEEEALMGHASKFHDDNNNNNNNNKDDDVCGVIDSTCGKNHYTTTMMVRSFWATYTSLFELFLALACVVDSSVDIGEDFYQRHHADHHTTEDDITLAETETAEHDEEDRNLPVMLFWTGLDCIVYCYYLDMAIQQTWECQQQQQQQAKGKMIELQAQRASGPDH